MARGQRCRFEVVSIGKTGGHVARAEGGAPPAHIILMLPYAARGSIQAGRQQRHARDVDRRARRRRAARGERGPTC